MNNSTQSIQENNDNAVSKHGKDFFHIILSKYFKILKLLF